MGLASSCGGGAADDVDVVVSAAASLADSFAAIEARFEEMSPGVDVVVNLAASSTLRDQILAGAPVDVFASADAAMVEELADAGLTAGEPVVFAHNELRIAVPAGNPAGVEGLEDFAKSGLLLGLCAEGVPCGDLARASLAAAGVPAQVDTHEPNVRALLLKVETGELDAGITYVSDIVSAGRDVEGIEIDDQLDVAAHYAIAVLTDSRRPGAASNFVDFVLSAEGRRTLEQSGFETS